MEKQKSFGIVVAVVIIVAVAGIGFALMKQAHPKPEQVHNINPSLLPGIQTSVAPWPVETEYLRDRLSAIGLPALSSEGTALHIHQHLDIFVHGKPVAVPAEIGVNQKANFISPIHTHDATSVIHVESPTIQDFTLGQFFDIWGVQFTAQSIGGYTADATNALKVFVNGKEFIGDPRAIILVAHQEIVITYGTEKELPNPIPASYVFPANE
jgi:hypothetical protein